MVSVGFFLPSFLYPIHFETKQKLPDLPDPQNRTSLLPLPGARLPWEALYGSLGHLTGFCEPETSTQTRPQRAEIAGEDRVSSLPSAFTKPTITQNPVQTLLFPEVLPRHCSHRDLSLLLSLPFFLYPIQYLFYKHLRSPSYALGTAVSAL